MRIWRPRLLLLFGLALSACSNGSQKPINSPPGPSSGPRDADVVVGKVQFIQDEQAPGYATAVVLVTNPNSGRWLPYSKYVFTAKDAAGAVLGSDENVVHLGPSASVGVVSPQISLGSTGARLATVEFGLEPKPWRSADEYPDVALSVVSAVLVKGKNETRVTGQLTSDSNQTLSIRIHCLLLDTAGAFAGTGYGTVADVGGQAKSPFEAIVLHSKAGAKTAQCYAEALSNPGLY